MPNVHQPAFDEEGRGYRRARLGSQADARHLGLSLWELEPGEESPFHYHLGNEELAIVLSGRVRLRTASGWRELAEGEVVSFPRGESGAHQVRNEGDAPARVLLVSELNEPNVSVYPDDGQIGVYDRAHRSERRFGALFDLGSAVSGYGGGRAEIAPPPPG